MTPPPGTAAPEAPTATSAPNVADAIGPPATELTEEQIQRLLAEERARLLEAEGVETPEIKHFQKPVERPFTKDQRSHTTLLFGGLTLKHERLCKSALEGLGYKVEYLECPDVQAFQLGKEFGNNGQCNPTYFTTGNLVKHLQKLRDEEGIPTQEILDNYIFLTAGACGPCRFGMYEAEFRLALRNSGFDGFRVMLFQQEGGLSQGDLEAGLEMSLDFFMGILRGIMIGDLLNEIGYQIRPYEVNPGETNRVLEECMAEVEEIFRSRVNPTLEGPLSRLLGNGGLKSTAEFALKFHEQLTGDYYSKPLEKVAAKLRAIECDYTRVRPIVKITGEFWAQTTEGDGNFNMFRFLEGEGAQVLVEPVSTWIAYMVWHYKQRMKSRKGIEDGQAAPPWYRFDKWALIEAKSRMSQAKIDLAGRIFDREYERSRAALGGTAHRIANQDVMGELARDFYNPLAEGGEGHLEVAKNIYYSTHDLCHMVLSVKPFGCMPSSQSDGAQAAVVSAYKDMIYLPIETSGEGEVNAHSRVQMSLGEARSNARAEMKAELERAGVTVEQVQAFAQSRPELQRGLHHIPHYKGVVGVSARFVRYCADLMGVKDAGPVSAAH
ncbi:MAG: activator of (R)-2-hydroxyglutaryl-CoA dehydratase [Planctomycetota bacterium]|jgi:predicted nucleotide-binding protein (sugar kinase/HSP70/actin superfamily)